MRTRSTPCKEFVDSLLPTEEQNAVADLLAAGDEGEPAASCCRLEPANEDVIVALGDLLVDADQPEEALGAARPDPGVRSHPSRSRHAARVGSTPDDDYDEQLTALLDQVKGDDDARQKFVDILELMGPLDSRTSDYRRQLTARLY